MRKFSDIFKHKNPDQEHIDAFHQKHKELEELGAHLHNKGYYIDIDYKSPHAKDIIRTDRHGSTHSFNHQIQLAKRIRISKSAIRPDD